MPTPYPWTCLACEAPNAAGAVRCDRCGCPSTATALQIETTRRNFRQRAGLPAVRTIDPVALLQSLPLLPIAAVLLLLGGAVFLIVGASGGGSAFGGLLIALAALAVSSYRVPELAANG